MSVKIALALGFLAAASAIAPKPAGSSMLRFQGAPAEDAKAPEKSSDPNNKPLSAAMKCVMALLFLYFIVVLIMKIIIFVKQIKKLYADSKQYMAQAGMKVPDVPTGGADQKASDAADKAKEQAAAMVAKVPGGAAANAAAGYTKDMFMNMFSEEKLAKVMTNMAMVPMFCILITFCRLRARVDLQSEPQPHAKTWMFVSTACLFVQILVVMLPDIPETPGNTSCCSCAKAWLYIMELVNLAGMVGLYAGIAIIIYAIFTLKFQEFKDSPSGAAATTAATAGATETAGAVAGGATEAGL